MSIINSSVAQPSQKLSFLGLTFLCSAFIAICAQINVPMYPVPVSLQSLAVLLVASNFGRKVGVASVLNYIGLGALGLPVFANFGSALTLVGPTAGYIFGFTLMAFVAGYLADKGYSKSYLKVFGFGLISSLLVYIPGVFWLSSFTGISKALEFGLFPFVVGDILKLVFLVLSVPSSFKFLRALSQ